MLFGFGKLRNILKNLTFKQYLRKLGEYFLVFIIFKILVFAIDSTVLRYNRLENRVVRYWGFYTKKQLENFFDKFYPVGSYIAPLRSDLLKNARCYRQDYKTNDYNKKGVFLTKNRFACFGNMRWFTLVRAHVYFDYIVVQQINGHDGYSHFALGKDRSYRLIDNVSFSTLSRISIP